MKPPRSECYKITRAEGRFSKTGAEGGLSSTEAEKELRTSGAEGGLSSTEAEKALRTSGAEGGLSSTEAEKELRTSGAEGGLSSSEADNGFMADRQLTSNSVYSEFGTLGKCTISYYLYIVSFILFDSFQLRYFGTMQLGILKYFFFFLNSLDYGNLIKRKSIR